MFHKVQTGHHTPGAS